MIAIADYGAGNLKSVKKALDFIGADNIITNDSGLIECADGIILPGVGSFADAMDCLNASGLVCVLKNSIEQNKPFLGICLGLQLLYGESDESPGARGLGVLEGTIAKIPSDQGLKVPHMGWNSIEIKKENALFKGIQNNSYVYFVHSYFLRAHDESSVSATTSYSVEIDAAVSRGNLFATQFHPEKSGKTGLKMLENFAELCGGNN